MKTKKKYDCVKMKYRGGHKILQTLKKMSSEQQLAYWQKHTESLRQRQQTFRRKNLDSGVITPDFQNIGYLAKNKPFDCVQMKRIGGNKIIEALKYMTLEEELAYWQEGTEKLRKQQQTARQKNML